MTNLASIIRSYVSAFPDELERLNGLLMLIENCSEEQLRSRSNWHGHATASGFVLSVCRSKILMVYHQKIGRRFQPGGHLEPEDPTPLAAAYREVAEETGCTAIDYVAYHVDASVPIDIDSHLIPETTKEPAHMHHDFRYVFFSSTQSEQQVDPHNPCAPAWFDLSDFLADPSFSHLTKKFEQLIERKKGQPQISPVCRRS